MKRIILFSLAVVFSFFAKAQDGAIKTSGDILLFAMPAAALGTTLIIGDKKGTWQFVKGFALNGALTVGLKSVISKERPDMSDNNSFPSGHTSTTFQSASFIQKRYGWKYGIPAYILSSYTGFSRIQADKHDIVDCLFGALIGAGSSYLFTTPYQAEHMELTFSKSQGSYLLGYVYVF